MKSYFSKALFSILTLSILGCTTPKNYASAVQAFDRTNKLEHLNTALKYAKTDQEKATIERKLVGYLGYKKVFDVIVTNRFGKNGSFTYSGFITNAKASTQQVTIALELRPKKNLPFKLKYNSYTIYSVLIKKTVYEKRPKYYNKILHNTLYQVIPLQKTVLSPSNNWNARISVTKDVMVSGEGRDGWYGLSKITLKDFKILPLIDAKPFNKRELEKELERK